jgi:FtsZ-interacting cell division protein ZipA
LKKQRSWGTIVVIALAVTLFLVAGLYAGTKAKDEFEMNAPYKHTKTKVVFTHTKHVTEHKLACGECHHDDKGKPLDKLKEGDAVQKCFECHKKPGELKGKAAKGLSKEQKREYHANALHDNCVGCHRTYNKEKKTKAAPTKCTECHPKDKKM